jgi:hypothetical protein
MLRLVFLCVLCAGLAPGGQKSGPPEVVLTEVVVHREESLITITAKLRNATDKTLGGVEVLFRFEDDAGKVLTTQRATLDEKKLAPGDVSEIGGQMKDSPLAVQMRVGVQTGSGRDLRVGNDGPFPID